MRKVAVIVCVTSLCVTLFLGALDIVICITLYDTIGQEFNDYANVGWLMAGYNLPNALFMLLWGRIASLVGLKCSLMASIVIFEAGSLMAGAANSMGMLIGARVISGFGGSGIESLVYGVGTSIVEEKHRARVITVLGIAYMLAEGAGPFVGGGLAEHVSWRWCFYVNLPIGGVALAALGWGYNPAGRAPGRALARFWVRARAFPYGTLLQAQFWRRAAALMVFRLDIPGLALSSGGFALVMLALTFGGNQYAWRSATIVCMFVFGAALLALFMLYDFVVLPRVGARIAGYEPLPLVPWRLAANVPVLTSSLCGFFNCFAFELQSIYLVQYYQLVVNKGPTLASVHLWQMSLPALVSVIASAVVNERFGVVKPLVLAGVVMGFVGSGLLTLVRSDTTLGQSIGFSVLAGASFGCVYQLSLISAQLQVERDDPDFHARFIEVTSYNTFIKTLGFSFAGIVSTTVFTVSLKNLASSHSASVPSFSTVEDLIRYRSENFDGRNSLLGRLLAKSVRNVFYCALVCSALSFLFGLFTSKKRTDITKGAESTELAELCELAEPAEEKPVSKTPTSTLC
ncbi:MDR family MFS transporter [Lachancea thermotolerans CBS 6340]|uniref:KLTH0D16962p n=1 Tax=Lachancea thermotolerans (strain ATCC 56472 / CBS 6340 / NRRL Y-8284) TaxID=559295 RepID=C5DFQ1_LACTC|nr:KLTH0D16962p [Lachancea thermotolerans CBS 6340]CAR23006.1 KLTH0D16962p [Lachancea thermotolerans CBS 6340]